jgi:hypothetical protein
LLEPQNKHGATLTTRHKSVGEMQSAAAAAAIVVCVVDRDACKPKLRKNRLSRCCSAIAMTDAEPGQHFSNKSISHIDNRIQMREMTLRLPTTQTRAPAHDGIHVAQFEASIAKSFFCGLGTEGDISWAAKS